MKAVLAPLSREGYADFSIRDSNGVIVEFDKAEAEAVRSYVPLVLNQVPQPYVSTTDAQVEIHTAQFKGSAQWGMWWTGRVRMMKIEDTDWLERYQTNREPGAVPGAWLDVSMEITQPHDRTQPATFIVKKVKSVLPPEPPQESMFG